ncbi:MAG TPA: hypothetical protein PKK01_04060 [Mycobacterium sp.]|nr:hypothetical protein [Mycobacterium sp.]HPZ94210.1 hypothetical protein [Mycobacterium sp.]HQE14992.1 hypothetical protein [Mycobacterium sp.]
MPRECRECLAGQPHCHGTLIRHPGGFWECTEPDCAHPEIVLHSFSLGCEMLGCECAEAVERLAV